MKLLAFAASSSRNSINHALVSYAVERLQSKVDSNFEFELLDLNDFELPLYSIDRENTDGIPQSAHDFFNEIGNSDALLISFAEHNGSVTAVWKNLFDWMSRIEMKLWQGKPVAMLAASPGGRAGASVLEQQKKLAPHFGAELCGQLGIGKWYEAWDASSKQLTNEADIAALDGLLSRLIQDAKN